MAESERAVLKVFVSVPNEQGRKPDPLSKDTLDHLLEVAWKEQNSEGTDMGGENRPPSPRPWDEKTRIQLHSEVLESWEDSTRFRLDVNLAVPKYRRSDSMSRSDTYRAE
jgi:hypothetical protein